MPGVRPSILRFSIIRETDRVDLRENRRIDGLMPVVDLAPSLQSISI